MKNHFECTGAVALVTGASSGIGRSIAQALHERGCRVYGTSRRAPAGEAQQLAPGHYRIRLDVTDDESVAAAVALVLAREGRIDLLVNNAGYGVAGPVEELPMAEAQAQLDTLFFGTVRMCRAVLGPMRAQGGGRIINISSVAGVYSVPFQAMYSAAKFAIEALGDALRMECAPFGIQLCSILPGDTNTGFADARRVPPLPADSPYAAAATRSIANMQRSERAGAPPQSVAREVLRVLRRRSMPVRVVVGWQYKAMVFAKRLTPARLQLAIIRRIY